MNTPVILQLKMTSSGVGDLFKHNINTTIKSYFFFSILTLFAI